MFVNNTHTVYSRITYTREPYTAYSRITYTREPYTAYSRITYTRGPYTVYSRNTYTRGGGGGILTSCQEYVLTYSIRTWELKLVRTNRSKFNLVLVKCTNIYCKNKCSILSLIRTLFVPFVAFLILKTPVNANFG